MPAPPGRRPLASRNTALARAIATRLARTRISPNQISMGAIIAGVFALMACMAARHTHGGIAASFLVTAALACQLRLLCNLFDGMVAIEGGRQTPGGEFWNEMPDRLADIGIFWGIGMAAGWPALGWAAATVAVCTAYVRELGRGIDGIVDFRGPMAKQHRMAVATLALLLAALINGVGEQATGVLQPWLEPLMPSQRQPPPLDQAILVLALWVCIVGGIVTLAARSRALLARLT